MQVHLQPLRRMQMLADPQTITISGSAKTLNRTGEGGPGQSVYRNADGDVRNKVSHTTSKGLIRTMHRIETDKIAVDPISTENVRKTLSTYLVIERPEVGFSPAEVDAQVQGHKTMLASALVTELIGMEV